MKSKAKLHRVRLVAMLTLLLTLLGGLLAAPSATANSGYAASCHGQPTTTFNGVRMFIISPTFILSAGEACQIGKASLRMQSDGNLVVYDENNKPRWASRTKVPWWAEDNFMDFQPDGNLVVYSYLYDAGGDTESAQWASGTNSGHYRLAVQSDGNVVIYTSSWHAVWATGTNH